MARGQSIFIPVANRAEEVEVQVDNLPAVNDVLDLLKAEEAPLHIWLDLAVSNQPIASQMTDIKNIILMSWRAVGAARVFQTKKG